MSMCVLFDWKTENSILAIDGLSYRCQYAICIIVYRGYVIVQQFLIHISMFRVRQLKASFLLELIPCFVGCKLCVSISTELHDVSGVYLCGLHVHKIYLEYTFDILVYLQIMFEGK